MFFSHVTARFISENAATPEKANPIRSPGDGVGEAAATNPQLTVTRIEKPNACALPHTDPPESLQI